MKKLTILTALVLGGCATGFQSQAPGASKSSAERVSYDAATEREMGQRIGYIFASPEKVATRIGREFAAFDSDYTGELNSYEFYKWLTPLYELRHQFDETPMTLSGEELEAWAERAHAFADTDRNGEVSQAELNVYFGGI